MSRHKLGGGRWSEKEAAATPHVAASRVAASRGAVAMPDATPILAKQAPHRHKGTIPVTSPESSHFRKDGTEWGHGMGRTVK